MSLRDQHPVLPPPETPEPKATFGTPLKNKDPGHPVDLDLDDMVVAEEKPEDEEEETDEPIELDELEGRPFSYFYLSAEDSPQVLKAEEEDDDDVILMEEASPPVNPAKDLEEEEGKDKPQPTSQCHQMWFLLPPGRRERNGLLQGRRR